MEIKTNYHWREPIYGCQLPEKYRKGFDYLDDDEYATREFTIYHGIVYDLGDFMRIEVCHPSAEVRRWDAYSPDTYFSGIVIRYDEDCEKFQIGYYYS